MKHSDRLMSGHRMPKKSWEPSEINKAWEDKKAVLVIVVAIILMILVFLFMQWVKTPYP